MTRALLAFGGAELALLITLGWLPAARSFPAPGLIVFGGAFAAYVLAAVWLTRRTEVPRATSVIWIGGVLMRLALLPLAPELSDDFYRYLWDGHVQLSGTNPYLFAPAAPELTGIRTLYHHLINNPSVPTIYPPLAQVAFAVVALAGSSVTFMKLLWVVCDLATAWTLARVASRTGRDPARVLLLYLWAPILPVEVAWSGHLEPLGLLPMAGSLWAATRLQGRGMPAAAGTLLAASALVKFAPAAALPGLARRGRGPGLATPRTAVVAMAAFALTAGVFYAPYAGAGAALFAGLRTYGEHWWFMVGAFGLVESAVGDPMAARRIVAGLVLTVVAYTWMARFDLERTLFWVLGAGMILTPTLHPWYVLWMLPFAALRSSPPWIALGGLAFLGYFGLGTYGQTGEWAQPGIVRAALWLPFFVLLAVEAARARRGEP